MVCNPGVELCCVSPGCGMFAAVGEYRIVIRSYGTPVVLAVYALWFGLHQNDHKYFLCN